MNHQRLRLPAALAAAVLILTACDTESAEDVTATSATLMAWAAPETTAADYYFQYGPTSQMGYQTPVRHPNALNPGQIYTIREAVSGLTPNTRYYNRFCGKERQEVEYRCETSVRSFVTTTFANPPQFRSANGTVDRYLHADPKIAGVDGAFYGTGTGCQLTKSDNGTLWGKLTDVCGTGAGQHPAKMVVDPGPGRVTFWGTEVDKVRTQWVAVTSGNRKYPERGPTYEKGAIWVATASSPQGPWTWRDEAIAMDVDNTLIDPSIFVDGERTWLTWTRQFAWGTGGAGTNQLVTQELDPADITRLRPGSAPVVLLSTDVQPQDRERAYGRRIVEGQGVFSYAGRYFLYYAAGNYTYGGHPNEPYTFNITESRTSFPGRFTKRANPDLKSGNGWLQPGHGSVFIDGGKNPWVATSPYKQGEPVCVSPDPEVRKWCGLARTVFLQKMTFNHETKLFSTYTGVPNTGQIGVPTP